MPKAGTRPDEGDVLYWLPRLSMQPPSHPPPAPWGPTPKQWVSALLTLALLSPFGCCGAFGLLLVLMFRTKSLPNGYELVYIQGGMYALSGGPGLSSPIDGVTDNWVVVGDVVMVRVCDWPRWERPTTWAVLDTSTHQVVDYPTFCQAEAAMAIGFSGSPLPEPGSPILEQAGHAPR